MPVDLRGSGWRGVNDQLGDLSTGHKRVNRGDANWPRPTADSLEHRQVMVASVDELTCCDCGDTTIGGVCWHCGKVDPEGRIVPGKTRMVRTLSYLHPGEYKIG